VNIKSSQSLLLSHKKRGVGNHSQPFWQKKKEEEKEKEETIKACDDIFIG